MKTIHPLHLEALYETGTPIELIDVRPESEFHKLHALGARSVPLPDFIPAEVLKTRLLSHGEPLYLICGEGGMAKRAAEDLQSAGFDNSVIVGGGTEAWEHHGLPMVRKASAGTTLRVALIAGLTIAFAAAVLSQEFLIALPLLIGIGIIALDLLETRRGARDFERQRSIDRGRAQTNSYRQLRSELSGESAVNGLDVIPPWMTGEEEPGVFASASQPREMIRNAAARLRVRCRKDQQSTPHRHPNPSIPPGPAAARRRYEVL